jgi:hypothetical protein
MYARGINRREPMSSNKAVCHGQQKVARQSLLVEGPHIFDSRFERSPLRCLERLERRPYVPRWHPQVISARARPVELSRELGRGFIAAKPNSLDNLASRLDLLGLWPLCRAGATPARKAQRRLLKAGRELRRYFPGAELASGEHAHCGFLNASL